MCGIAGLLEAAPRSGRAALLEQVLRMADTLAHRGPDDRGAWADETVGIALGHRRLSVLDPSKRGAQPMASGCGRYVISYNGEIYNFRELRSQLEQSETRLRGHSDTEVLVEAISHWGLESTLQRANGMFALAVWDAAERTLTLARDRIGKKPLYYGWCGPRFLFASELKALRAHRDFRAEIDRDALGLLVRYSYIPAPRSILKGVSKLEAGHLATLRVGDAPEEPTPRCYWSCRQTARAAVSDPFPGSRDEAVVALEQLLSDAVSRRMLADVELGALLSGGVDSSTVVALMQAHSERPVRSFCIGFREQDFDEAGHARAVAKHLGTQHEELYITSHDALRVIPELPSVFDEPFADVSQIPTLLVSRLARNHVTVALSGDGGDELFGGYRRYRGALARWRAYSLLPLALRRGAARALAGLASAVGVGRAEQELALLDASSPVEIFARKSARCESAARFVVGAGAPDTALEDPRQWATLAEPIQQMMLLDQCLLLPEDILTKVDRASMAASLEVRSPLLDHRVVELAWRVTGSFGAAGDEPKWLLRQVLDRHVPRALTERPKMGFGVPVDSWLRGPLREWAESLLDARRLREQGFLHAPAVREVWRQHQSGRRDWHALLWSILMFQAWLESA